MLVKDQMDFILIRRSILEWLALSKILKVDISEYYLILRLSGKLYATLAQVFLLFK